MAEPTGIIKDAGPRAMVVGMAVQADAAKISALTEAWRTVIGVTRKMGVEIVREQHTPTDNTDPDSPPRAIGMEVTCRNVGERDRFYTEIMGIRRTQEAGTTGVDVKVALSSGTPDAEALLAGNMKYWAEKAAAEKSSILGGAIGYASAGVLWVFRPVFAHKQTESKVGARL